MHRILALTAAAFLVAVPISLAQTTPTPAAPPSAQQSPVPTTPAPTPRAAPAPTMSQNVDGTPQCRTRKDVGEQCSCLSAPTDFGTAATAVDGGRNQCVVPGSASDTAAATPRTMPAPTPSTMPAPTPAPTPAPSATPQSPTPPPTTPNN